MMLMPRHGTFIHARLGQVYLLERFSIFSPPACFLFVPFPRKENNTHRVRTVNLSSLTTRKLTEILYFSLSSPSYSPFFLFFTSGTWILPPTLFTGEGGCTPILRVYHLFLFSFFRYLKKFLILEFLILFIF